MSNQPNSSSSSESEPSSESEEKPTPPPAPRLNAEIEAPDERQSRTADFSEGKNTDRAYFTRSDEE